MTKLGECDIYQVVTKTHELDFYIIYVIYNTTIVIEFVFHHRLSATLLIKKYQIKKY